MNLENQVSSLNKSIDSKLSRFTLNYQDSLEKIKR
jgi:hypothetical protein